VTRNNRSNDCLQLVYTKLQALILRQVSILFMNVSAQDQLTEVGHSVVSGAFKALHGLVLSLCCSTDTLANTLVIDGEFLSYSVDAGFVPALPLHHGDLELDSAGVSTESYLTIMLLFLVAWTYTVEGPMHQIKVPVQ